MVIIIYPTLSSFCSNLWIHFVCQIYVYNWNYLQPPLVLIYEDDHNDDPA